MPERTLSAWSRGLPSTTTWTMRVIQPERTDDQFLVAASLDGDTSAFDRIVERHQRTVYNVCYRFAGNHDDASDLVQETFVRAWRGLKSFKAEAALSTWLYRIAVNVCLNHAGAKRVATEPIVEDRFVDASAEVPGSSLVRRERAEALRQAIEQLPAKQRATVVLRTYQELSHQQIAQILGSSVGAVKANLFHALANLRKILGSEP